MSIQTAPFPLVVDANDLQYTYRGISFAVKLQEIVNFGQIVYFMVKNADGEWNPSSTLDDGFDIHIGNYGGDVFKYLTEKLLPALNVALANLYPAGSTSTPVESKTNFQLLHTMLGTIKFGEKSDGTLVATIL